MKLTYAVVIEQTPSNYCAYAPDVPGCISTADTAAEMMAMIREALTFHIEELIDGGDPIPTPSMSVDEAIAYHSRVLADADAAVQAEYGKASPTLSTRFETVEIEIAAGRPTLIAVAG